MESNKNMDIEAEGDSDLNKLIVQNEKVSYLEAYSLNGCEVVDTATLIEILAAILGRILTETDKFPDNNFSSGFTAKSVPSISVRDYLKRIATCSHCSDECFILALIYIDRITENKKFIIKSLNIHRSNFAMRSSSDSLLSHRLLLVGVMLAAKFFDDIYYNNEYYSRVGGIPKKEINQLEIEFLNYINFTLYVDPIIFFRYRERLLAQAKM